MYVRLKYSSEHAHWPQLEREFYNLMLSNYWQYFAEDILRAADARRIWRYLFFLLPYRFIT